MDVTTARLVRDATLAHVRNVCLARGAATVRLVKAAVIVLHAQRAQVVQVAPRV